MVLGEVDSAKPGRPVKAPPKQHSAIADLIALSNAVDVFRKEQIRSIALTACPRFK